MKVLVCVNCKLRKKKCDKVKPCCGYCKSKNLDCQYAAGDDKILLQVRSKSALITDNPIIRSSLLVSNTLADVLSSDPTNLDSTIYLQTLRIIRETGQFVDDISAQYFQGIHPFIPVISRSRFHDNLLDFGAPPSADFSTLLLAMSLTTYYPEKSGHDESSVDQFSLYLVAKTMFTQVCSSSPPSLHLIQTGIILATYEYANGKVENALSSIGLCARMGYACRIHLSNPNTKLEGNEFLQAEEEANTWWGIAICERTFFCELDDFDQPFAARFPDVQAQLPRETYSSKDDNQFKPGQPTDTAEASMRNGGYACIAQAAWLLDQVFKAIELTDIDAKLIQLGGLDSTLRTFLTIVMEQSKGKWGKFCTANAILIRALFTLHWEILNQVQHMSHCRHKSPEEWHKTSSSALDTLVKIVEDIAATQNGHPISVVESLPPSRAYVMRAALRHIEYSEIKSELWEQTKAQLELSLGQFDHRWGVNV